MQKCVCIQDTKKENSSMKKIKSKYCNHTFL